MAEGVSTEAEQAEFFEHNDKVLTAFYKAADVNIADGTDFAKANDLVTSLAHLLSQANAWGQRLARREAAQELRDWADTFGVGPTAEGIKAIVREGADKIEKD